MAIETDDCNISEFLVPRPIVRSIITARHRQLVELAEPTSNKQHPLPPPGPGLFQQNPGGPVNGSQCLPSWVSREGQA